MAFILYDVETSGLNKRFDQILQFAAVSTDADLVETHRFETRSRLMPHVVPSPKALHVTGMSLDDANSMSRPSHYSMVCEIANTLAFWCPATFLGFNSIRFDEEFLRQAFYQCLHPVFLTNTNGQRAGRCPQSDAGCDNAAPFSDPPGRRDRRAPQPSSGRRSPRRTASCRYRVHDAAVRRRCHARIVQARPSTARRRSGRRFLRFSSKAAVVDLVRDEDAFAYFDFFGHPRVMHFLTRVGVSPNDANAHYCLDLECDIDGLRKLDDAALAERTGARAAADPAAQGQRLSAAVPLVGHRRRPLPRSDGGRTIATGVVGTRRREFMAALTRAAASLEPIYAPSEHVELQIYGGNFFSDSIANYAGSSTPVRGRRDRSSSAVSTTDASSASRADLSTSKARICSRKRSGAIAEDIAARRRGEGKYASPPWTTIAQALPEIETIDGRRRTRSKRHTANCDRSEQRDHFVGAPIPLWARTD